MLRKASVTMLVLTILLGTLVGGAAAQPDPAIAETRKVLDLLREGKSDDVAAQFNEKMAAALSKEQLAQVWAAVGQQTGAFKEVIDDQVLTPEPGITAVVLGLQFEKVVANFMVAFDAQKKIAGLTIRPRPPK